MIFSCIIPAKDDKDPKLKDLIKSIRSQQFDQNAIEIIVVTEGDSESAKSIGIKKASGEICAMFCADNLILDPYLFKKVYDQLTQYPELTGVYTKHYAYLKDDNSLNRYFSLMGVNDPIAYYVKKADRDPYTKYDENLVIEIKSFKYSIPSLGDNGFFYRRSHIIQSKLDNYYPMDCAEDLRRRGMSSYAVLNGELVWHRTSDTLWNFLRKRYIYARDLYCDREDRRWKIVGNSKDKFRVLVFALSSALVIPNIIESIKGYRRVKDFAWFWHPIVCLGFLLIYSTLALRNLFHYKSLFSKQEKKWRKSKGLKRLLSSQR